ncbi:MAG: aspartate--tRNA ligase [Desulfobacterales bacterium]|nr:aspartate--tRNA ligase [Desulfobacterales bacterium]
MKETDELQIDSLGDWKRTHDCGSLTGADVGREVLLMGWVNSRRDLGSLIFIDLRDREGITQIVFDPNIGPAAHQRAHVLRNEWVCAVRGTVSPRLKGQENPKLPTGEIEVKASEIRILNRTETPPFQVDGSVDASETLRLKYRYLELRRKRVFENFRRRHLMTSCVREYLNRTGFIDVETPYLTKSTPEGARDYLVPSRVSKGHFYALPQSPQLFKQLLMVSGFDKYYQIVRCFRDEDLRADRQPEFTQIDIEMSFVNEDGVIAVVEGMLHELFQSIIGMKISLPIPRLEYHDAMERFGTDRPDMRFGLEIVEVTDLARESEFQVFKEAVEKDGAIKAIRVEGGAAAISRKQLDELSRQAVNLGARGLLSVKIGGEGWQSSMSKFLKEETKGAIDLRMGAKPGDMILLVADRRKTANQVLGQIRLELSKRLNLIKPGEYSLVWITKFPLLEYNEAEGRLDAVHHPFTSPLDEDLPLLERQPENARARAYDIVLNGSEIGGGSVRIHNNSLQERMFRLLGISKEQADMKFGFFLEALRYGAPPHAGIALGLDRLVAIMCGVDSIREVIAFPKTATASCLLSDAPSKVDSAQLRELGIRLIES